MSYWKNLIEEGMAEFVAPKTANPILELVKDKFHYLDPMASVAMLEAVCQKCNVVQFNKNAVINDFGQMNPQLLIKIAGNLKIFMQLADGITTSGWTSSPKDSLFVTQDFYSRQGSELRIVAVEPTICVTLHWDDHQYLERTHPEFSMLALMIAHEFSNEVDRRNLQVQRSISKRLSGL